MTRNHKFMMILLFLLVYKLVPWLIDLFFDVRSLESDVSYSLAALVTVVPIVHTLLGEQERDGLAGTWHLVSLFDSLSLALERVIDRVVADRIALTLLSLAGLLILLVPPFEYARGWAEIASHESRLAGSNEFLRGPDLILVLTRTRNYMHSLQFMSWLLTFTLYAWLVHRWGTGNHRLARYMYLFAFMLMACGVMQQSIEWFFGNV